MQSLESKIQAILQSELEYTKQEVVDSMVANKQVASGRTMQSLRVEADSDKGILWGAEHIPTLEEGISPQASQQAFDLRRTQGLIYQWSTNKGIAFPTKKERWWFAANTGRLQQQSGSLLFRHGGRKDVYTDKIQPALDRIGNKITTEFVNIKLVQ